MPSARSAHLARSIPTSRGVAVLASVDAPRTRRTFARLSKSVEVPNLIDIQKKSFAWLVDPEGGGLRETIDDISPIEDYTGDFPWMTDRGTFVINGTERVVVTQLVRSPGAYLMEPKDPEKQVFVANLMPARGSWLELEIDKKGRVYVRIDRKRKIPVTVLLRAMGY